LYANVIVSNDAPGLRRAYTYAVPKELEDAVFEGACVAIPFGGREMVGYVSELTDVPPEVGELKDLAAVINEACALNPSLIHLADWLSTYYVSSLTSAVRVIVPEVMSASVSSTVRLLDRAAVHPSSPNQQKLVKVLAEMGGEADSDVLKAKAGIDKFGVVLRQLRERRAVEVVRVLELPKAKPLIVRGLQLIEDGILPDIQAFGNTAPKQAALLKELASLDAPVRQAELLRRVGTSSGPARALIAKQLAEKVDMRIRRKPFESREVAPRSDYDLTLAQADAVSIIGEGLESDEPQTTLLYGVTGSGKTEVYLRSIEQALENGKGCIALVPEISLTVHLMDAYRSWFGEKVAILHSRLSVGERHDEWRRLESGEARVALGARSAVFAPVRDLGLIVVDEEHEPSYKQDNNPRYNARLAAEERARSEGASVVLGSATPSVETFYRASSGEIKLAMLDKRIDDRPLPSLSVVDLRAEFDAGRRNVFSEQLTEAISERLAKREQVILFVNRRGYASFVLCRTCGYTARCHNCDVSLTYHSAAKILRCHHCDEMQAAPTICPKCGGPHIRQFGIGTERVEEEARKLFPEASVIRMDADTTQRKGAHAKLLDTFRDGKADILVGTQMVAKGLDFPNVTLVGVVSADTSLHIPDFRASERTFQLLTQVSGRAGRGTTPGEAIIQTFSPDHYAIRSAVRQDYLNFYGQEIAYRRELLYPPFSQLVNIVSSDPMDGYPEDRLRALASAITERVSDGSVTLLGPSPAPLSKLRGLHRWHIVLKNHRPERSAELQEVLVGIAESMPASMAGVTIDVDPLTML